MNDARPSDEAEQRVLGLLVLTALSGLIDAVTFLQLGAVFVANMTGNVVFFAFGASLKTNLPIVAPLCSLAGFLVGAAVCGRIISRCWPRGKRWLLLSLALEIIVVAAAGGLMQAMTSSAPRNNIVLALLGLAMGAQNAVARQLSIKDLQTSVVTGLLTGLVAVTLPARNNPHITRRLMAVVALVIGAFGGAWLVASFGVPVALFVAVGLLALAAAVFSTLISLPLENENRAAKFSHLKGTIMTSEMELLASCWTTAGNVGPGWPNERSPFILEERIAAAASVGYTGFGLVHADLTEARDSIGYVRLRALLGRHNIQHVEVEMLNDWFTDGPTRVRSDQVRHDLLVAAAELGAQHIKVGGALNKHIEWNRFVEEFRALCIDAHHVGTRISFEPMPFCNVSDLATGRRLVDNADHEAGGLMIDLWHMCRAQVNFDEIASLPERYIFAVELDDADHLPIGDLMNDTLNHRKLCGEGNQDVAGFIRAVKDTGFRGPWGVEILSEQFRQLSLKEQAERSWHTARDALKDACLPRRVNAD